MDSEGIEFWKHSSQKKEEGNAIFLIVGERSFRSWWRLFNHFLIIYDTQILFVFRKPDKFVQSGRVEQIDA